MKKLPDCIVFWVITLVVLLWLAFGCEDENAKTPNDVEPNFFYDAEGPVLIVKQATKVRQLSLFLGQFGESELRPTKEKENPETPASVVWDSNSPLVDSNDYIVIWNNYDTCEYVFDANSDPLTIGKMMVLYMKTNPAYGSTITFLVPLKDKVEYDAILEAGTKL